LSVAQGPSPGSVKVGVPVKILVYGAGPLGSYFAATLREADLDVTILARGGRFRSIRWRGIYLEPFEGGERRRVKVPAVERLGPLDAYDLVMVVVGKNYYYGVLPFLLANINTPNVLFMGNNAAGPGEMLEQLGEGRVLLGFPGMSGAMEGSVVRYMSELTPKITMGEPDGRTTERLESFRAAFEGAGIEVEVCGDMDSWLKHHAAVVLPLCGAYARAGGDLEALRGDKEGVALMVRAIREGFGVLRELGHPLMPERLRRLETTPMFLLLPLVRRSLNRGEMRHVFAHADAMRGELSVLDREFRELIGSTSVETPAYDELSGYLRE
jgi:2-dehydropantoate 2-reductase